MLRQPPSLLGFPRQSPSSALACAEQRAALAQCQSSNGEHLSHPQKVEKGLPQTLPSACEAFGIELLLALHPTSWKLFERFLLFFRQKAIFKA